MILVTPDEYYSIGFLFIIAGLLYTMYQLFDMPHGKDDDEEL